MAIVTVIIEALHEFSLCTVKVAILCVFVVVVVYLWQTLLCMIFVQIKCEVLGGTNYLSFETRYRRAQILGISYFINTAMYVHIIGMASAYRTS